MKNFSNKRQKVQNSYNLILKEIKREREEKCEGCGNLKYLSPSHLIPRSRRPDLIADKRNIRFHCMEGLFGKKGCSIIWESGSLEEKQGMFDFEENIEFIKEVDLEYYNCLIGKKWKK